MDDIGDGTFAVCVFAGTMLIIAALLAFIPHDNKIMELGDEVTTTNEYTMLFNDSFTGRVVAIDELYSVRDENGAEREFERAWLVKYEKSTGVLTPMPEAIRHNPLPHAPNTVLYMNASAAMGMATKDEQGNPMFWVNNTSGGVWIMVSNGHQVPVNVTDIENIETTYSYIDTFEYVDQPCLEKCKTEEI